MGLFDRLYKRLNPKKAVAGIVDSVVERIVTKYKLRLTATIRDGKVTLDLDIVDNAPFDHVDIDKEAA